MHMVRRIMLLRFCWASVKCSGGFPIYLKQFPDTLLAVLYAAIEASDGMNETTARVTNMAEKTLNLEKPIFLFKIYI